MYRAHRAVTFTVLPAIARHLVPVTNALVLVKFVNLLLGHIVQCSYVVFTFIMK